MRGFLLDTNVVSELTKRSPDSGVIAFLTNQSDLWLSSVVLHELAFGLNLLPPGQRRDRIGAALTALVAEYADRVIVLGATEAEDAAPLRAQAHRSGRVLHLGDALTAGTAKAHDLCMATRDISHFADLDVEVTNPWEMP